MNTGRHSSGGRHYRSGFRAGQYDTRGWCCRSVGIGIALGEYSRCGDSYTFSISLIVLIVRLGRRCRCQRKHILGDEKSRVGCGRGLRWDRWSRWRGRCSLFGLRRRSRRRWLERGRRRRQSRRREGVGSR